MSSRASGSVISSRRCKTRAQQYLDIYGAGCESLGPVGLQVALSAGFGSLAGPPPLIQAFPAKEAAATAMGGAFGCWVIHQQGHGGGTRPVSSWNWLRNPVLRARVRSTALESEPDLDGGVDKRGQRSRG